MKKVLRTLIHELVLELLIDLMYHLSNCHLESICIGLEVVPPCISSYIMTAFKNCQYMLMEYKEQLSLWGGVISIRTQLMLLSSNELMI